MTPQRICIYTAVTGGSDIIRPPAVISPEADYYAFCDDSVPQVPAPWVRRPAEIYLRNPRVSYKYYKILAHRIFPDYDVSLWLDGNFQIRRDPVPLVLSCLCEKQAAFFPHPDRDCLYEESRVVCRQRLEHEIIVREQMEKYRAEGYQPHSGLICSCIMARRHNHPTVAAAMETWWQEVSRHAQRDQLSANYAFWKNGLEYDRMPGRYWKHECFRRYRHRRRKHYLDMDHLQAAEAFVGVSLGRASRGDGGRDAVCPAMDD